MFRGIGLAHLRLMPTVAQCVTTLDALTNQQWAKVVHISDADVFRGMTYGFVIQHRKICSAILSYAKNHRQKIVNKLNLWECTIENCVILNLAIEWDKSRCYLYNHVLFLRLRHDIS